MKTKLFLGAFAILLILSAMLVTGSQTETTPVVVKEIEVPLFVSPSAKSVPGVTFTPTVVGQPEASVKKVKDLKLNLNRTIQLEGQIGNNAIEATIILAKLNAESSEDITLLINSPGGSVIHGSRLISAMQTSKSKIKTVCLSMCASMAFIIHQYGSERLALDRAILMSHPASVGYEGDVDRIMSFIGTIQRYTNKLEAEVAKRMGISFSEYKQKIQNEYWVDAEDALKDKVVDGLVNLTINGNAFNDNSFPEQKKEVTKAKVKEFDIIWIMPGYTK